MKIIKRVVKWIIKYLIILPLIFIISFIGGYKVYYMLDKNIDYSKSYPNFNDTYLAYESKKIGGKDVLELYSKVMKNNFSKTGLKLPIKIYYYKNDKYVTLKQDYINTNLVYSVYIEKDEQTSMVSKIYVDKTDENSLTGRHKEIEVYNNRFLKYKQDEIEAAYVLELLEEIAKEKENKISCYIYNGNTYVSCTSSELINPEKKYKVLMFTNNRTRMIDKIFIDEKE